MPSFIESMEQSHVNLLPASPPYQPHFSQDQVSVDSDEFHADSKGYSSVESSNHGDSNREDPLKRLIYLHVVRVGDCILKGEQYTVRSFVEATNDWYVIKHGSDGGAGIFRVFEDIEQLNYPNHALRDTTCQAIGSCIYVIGGCSTVSCTLTAHVTNSGPSKVRYLDTRNPKDGWRTSFTLPYSVCESTSTVVNDEDLYLFGGTWLDYNDDPLDPWGLALNVHDDNKEKQFRKIAQPGTCSRSRFAFSSSPNLLFAYMEEEGALYQLDCTKSTWSLYQKDLPFNLSMSLVTTAVSNDGILHVYDTVNMRLSYYDMHNKKELHVVDLPDSFWFGRSEFVNLIVLAKDKFCIIWDGLAHDVNYMYIYYTRFSVSYLGPKPAVVLEETKSFCIGGVKLINVVAVDAPSDSDSTSRNLSYCTDGSE